MKKILFVLFSLIIETAVGQIKSREDIISDFKKDIMETSYTYNPDTLIIDTLILIREKQINGREIKIFSKNGNTICTEIYYNKSAQIKSLITTDREGNNTGITKQFSTKGILEYYIDYDKGEYIVYNKKKYPYYDLQKIMKGKADSLISNFYGQSFLKNHVVWNLNFSGVNFELDYIRDWTGEITRKPMKYFLHYDVKLDNKNRYENLISFELDANGKFVSHSDKLNYGFESIPDSCKGNFKLTLEDAINLVKKLENDTAEINGALQWVNFTKQNINHGEFRVNVNIRKETTSKLNSKGQNITTEKFEVYSFSPWNGKLVEKKKMKMIFTDGNGFKSCTGLIPDN